MGIQFVKNNFSKDSEIGNMAEKASLGFCPLCGKPVSSEEFRDELSIKEFKISGMCQRCQDDFFKED